MAVPAAEDLSLRRRAVHFGWLTAILGALALGLLAVAIVLGRTGDSGPQLRQALVPLNVQLENPGGWVIAAVALLVAATFVGLAELQTATAMRVLAPDRRVPPPLPPTVRRARRMLLWPVEPELESVEHLRDLPPGVLPTSNELPAATVLRCTVLIPAHNEEAILGLTLASLAKQTRPPDRVVVVADNCTDRTVEVARAHDVEVFATVGNAEKKAGALNQQLVRLLPDAERRDVVMVMDADSTVAPVFLEVALGLMEVDPSLTAVGGLFYGENGARLVGQLQRNEYTRYQRLVARKRGRVFVLTGTASVIRSYALRAVAEARGPLIPGRPGQVYDTLAMTEDNELTFALKTLGARMTSPPECRVTTEIMTSYRDLWRQRLRWQRGALENIGAYGLTRATAQYWGQQLGLAYGLIALQSYFLLMGVTLLAADSIRVSPFWVAIAMIFVVERIVTAWRAGWPGRAVAFPIVLELGYAVFLQVCFVTSFVQIMVGRKAGWNDVPRPTAPVLLAPWLVVSGFTVWGILLPTTVLTSDWYAVLAYWVGFNTLVFAFLSLLHMLPPLHLRRRAGGVPARQSPTGTDVS
ncbi:glycosyltransferase family 2 protein [Nocardioides sp. Iso805N]|uniref:glycosyltransferase family 2 protein n=1 Tax=Nocardioides sp. Iso805N TaxID=1283287 RepID=UPI0003683C49|nr:glycosyltransferase family 2 protein [Nocardioides sp. Iso805N]